MIWTEALEPWRFHLGLLCTDNLSAASLALAPLLRADGIAPRVLQSVFSCDFHQEQGVPASPQDHPARTTSYQESTSGPSLINTAALKGPASNCIAEAKEEEKKKKREEGEVVKEERNEEGKGDMRVRRKEERAQKVDE